ncbi:MAG: metal ABC transporter ATP-binding protein [Clostridia bacterium]
MNNANNFHKLQGSGDACSGLCCTRLADFGVTIGKTKILEQVNLHVHCGELTAIIGPNGAGKSTLLKAMLGEVRATGELKYMDALGGQSEKPLIGYVPQHLNFDTSAPTSVLDLFMACRFKFPTWVYTPKKIVEQIRASLARVKVEQLLYRRLGALSGGEIQRVLLALALDPVPDLLLLDEPVSGIDHNGLQLFYETVSDLRKNFDLSVILVSHDLDLVYQYADRVILLNKMVLEDGKPKDVFQSDNFMEVFSLRWQKSSAGERKNNQ